MFQVPGIGDVVQNQKRSMRKVNVYGVQSMHDFVIPLCYQLRSPDRGVKSNAVKAVTALHLKMTDQGQLAGSETIKQTN